MRAKAVRFLVVVVVVALSGVAGTPMHSMRAADDWEFVRTWDTGGTYGSNGLALDASGNLYVVVTLVETNHWRSGKGAAAGTISLLGEDGTLYGPWPAMGRPSGTVADAYWFVEPWVELPPGTYTVIDSQPTTWTHSTWTKGVGYVRVLGHDAPVDAAASPAPAAAP